MDATLTGSIASSNNNSWSSDLVPKIDDHDGGLNQDLKQEADRASKGIACSNENDK